MRWVRVSSQRAKSERCTRHSRSVAQSLLPLLALSWTKMRMSNGRGRTLLTVRASLPATPSLRREPISRENGSKRVYPGDGPASDKRESDESSIRYGIQTVSRLLLRPRRSPPRLGCPLPRRRVDARVTEFRAGLWSGRGQRQPDLTIRRRRIESAWHDGFPARKAAARSDGARGRAKPFSERVAELPQASRRGPDVVCGVGAEEDRRTSPQALEVLSREPSRNGGSTT